MAIHRPDESSRSRTVRRQRRKFLRLGFMQTDRGRESGRETDYPNDARLALIHLDHSDSRPFGRQTDTSEAQAMIGAESSVLVLMVVVGVLIADLGGLR